MVDALGHLGMALVFATPAWFVWRPRAAVSFVVFALLLSEFPDVDKYLLGIPGVEHHGVTHTVVFVVGVSLVAAALAARWGRGLLDRFGFPPAGTVTTTEAFAFAFSGLLVGGLSHLFADMLSAPDVAQEVEPFWPLFEKPIHVDVAYYDDPLWNAGLLGVAIALHVALYIGTAQAPERGDADSR